MTTMDLLDLQRKLNRECADVPASVEDIPDELRDGTPPKYFNGEEPLAWDERRILVSKFVRGGEGDSDHWRYAIY